MLADQSPGVVTPRSPTAPTSRIGLVTLWTIAVFVTLCLVALSLIYGAAERRRINRVTETRRIFPRRAAHPVAGDA